MDYSMENAIKAIKETQQKSKYHRCWQIMAVAIGEFGAISYIDPSRTYTAREVHDLLEALDGIIETAQEGAAQ